MDTPVTAHAQFNKVLSPRASGQKHQDSAVSPAERRMAEPYLSQPTKASAERSVAPRLRTMIIGNNIAWLLVLCMQRYYPSRTCLNSFTGALCRM